MATPQAIRAIKGREGHDLRADWMLVRAIGPSRPLPLDATRTTVTARVPPSMPARRMVAVPSETCNEGDARLASTPPNPVHLSYRWYRDADDVGTYGLRTVCLARSSPGPGRRSS